MVRATTQSLQVRMNDITVGRLIKKSTMDLTFIYDPDWLADPQARPISLSMPLAGEQFTGNLVYNFFDNLLPDNPQIRARIQARFQAASDRPFDLLTQIGKDCIGALQLVPETFDDTYTNIQCTLLTDQDIAYVLSHYQQAPLGMLTDADDFRISIAGVQEKSAFLHFNGQWNRPSGTTPTTHIFKLPIGVIQHHDQTLGLSESCENEWLCAKILAEFGLPVAACEIQHFADTKVLVVERFDRKFSKDGSHIIRLPQEDICQALGYSPNLKYQADGGPGIVEVMKLLLNAQYAARDRDVFYKSQVVFHLLAAIDGHGKNFSIFIGPEGKYALTPFYDIMSAHPLMASKQLHAKKIKMAMALRGKNNHYHWHDVQYRNFIETAKHADYSSQQATNILNETLEAVEKVINTVSSMIPSEFPAHIAKAVFAGMLAAKNKLIR